MTTLAKYNLGPPLRPNIKHDNGFLDKFPARTPTVAERAKYLLWRGALESGEAIQGVPFFPKNDLPDALAAYRHFMEGSGKDRDFNAERYVANDASGRTTLQNITLEAKSAAYDLHGWKFMGKPVVFRFTGTKLSATRGGSKFSYPNTENWQKAIGGYSFWISADVEVTGDKNNFEFDMDFVVHFEDKYNFNPGQADIATGIPDNANGIFEVTGLASQYLSISTISRQLKWVGAPTGKHILTASGGGRVRRQRRPSDNRRIRNRL